MNLPVIDLDVVGGGGGSGLNFKYSATNYADLLTKVGMIEGDLAYVYNSQGSWILLNRRPAGVYQYQLGVWEYGSQDLQDQIEGLLTNEFKVKVTGGDTTGAFLGSKLITTDDIEISLNNIGGNETLSLLLSKSDPRSFSFTRNNNDFVQANGIFYESVAKIAYVGSDDSRVPTNIIANVWNDGGTSVTLRVSDVTNFNTIAEVTGITSSSSTNLVDMGVLSNLPSGNAVFSVELILVGGGMGDQAKISSLTIY